MVRLTDRPNITLDVYRGRKTIIQQQLLDYDWNVHDDLCGSDHFPVLLNNIGPDIGEPVSRWKSNKANWAQFQTLSTTRLIEDTVRKADDPIGSFASILIDIAEETVPKAATKSKKV